MGETTGGEQPERVVLVGHVLDIFDIKNGLVGNSVITSVTGVIEEQHAVLEQVSQAVLGQWITLSAGIHFLWIGIQENLVYHEIRVLKTYHLGALLCRLGVSSVLAVVRQIDNLVLPFADILVVVGVYVVYVAD